MSLKKLLKDIRSEKGITQKELAEAIGVSIDAVKKIETSQTQSPSTKVLDALVKFTGRNRVDIVHEILIDEENIEKLNSLTNEERYFGLHYLAYRLVDGWNITKIFPQYTLERTGQCNLIGEYCKKKDPNYCVLVNRVTNLYDINENIKNEFDLLTFGVNVVKVCMDFNNGYRRMDVVFDFRNENELYLFNKLALEQRPMLITAINCVLFDSVNGEIIEEYRWW